MKLCMRCGKKYAGYPALSRRDNKTDICSDCGVEESMVDMARKNLPEPVLREIKFMSYLLNNKE